MLRSIIFTSCIALLLHPGYATKNSYEHKAFDPQRCAQDVANAGVCLTEFAANLGKPSAACCEALNKIGDDCLPALFPPNPLFAPYLKNLCRGGKDIGFLPVPTLPFPFPFPFPPVGGGRGLPFPFPGVGAGVAPPSPN